MTSPITSFFKNKSVFITGGTGFLGKVLIEKLLYSCRDINAIYMQIKPKNGRKIDDRMNDLFRSPAFQRIHKENPTALGKIIPIAGDLRAEQLGINNKDMTTLHENVSVVFHAAAVIKFNYDLGPSVHINTKGTQKLLDICKGIPNLQSFVYVSTAYSRCPTKVIDENPFESEIPLEKLYEALKDADMNEYKRLVGARPNAYTYSKALAEHVIAKEARVHDIPAAIVRPSLIMSAVSDPMPGFVENWYGWNAIIAGGARGVLRSALCDAAASPCLAPADYVANLCVAAAWDTHTRRENGDKTLKVFNCSSGVHDSMTQEDLINNCLRHSRNIVKHTGPKPNIYITTNKYKHSTVLFLKETIPAFFLRLWEKVTGRKSEILQLYNRSRAVTDVCSYFMINEFKFLDANTLDLHTKLERSDAKTFNFNVKDIEWNATLRNYVYGLNKYVMGQS